MKCGIVLLALNDFAYGYWAWNLAMSIKAHSAVPIQIITDGHATSDLTEGQMKVFDVVTEIPYQDKLFNSKFEPGWTKVNLYKYLAFNESIYFDVDAVCVKDVMPLFDMCKGKDYCTQVHGEGKMTDEDWGMKMYWAKPDIINKYFDGIKSIPFTNSSFQYIRKSSKTRRLFNVMKNIFGVIPATALNETWGRSLCQPDELYLNIALAITGTDARLEQDPVYFTVRWGKQAGVCKTLEEIKQDHFLIGYWGRNDFNHKNIERMYDGLMQKCVPLHKYKISRLMKKKFININYA